MQGLELFSVLGKLVLDKSGFDSDVKQADESGKNLAENLTSYMEKAKKVIKGVFAAVAVKKAASFIWDLANNTATAGDRIDKTSQSLGMSRKAFQEWDYILSQSGASIDSMGMTMKTLTEAIATNSAETAAGLSKLGLSAAQLQSMSAEEQFETLVKAFQEMPEGVEKSRLAVQLFGRGAQSLMPLLNSASGTVDDLRQRAHDLGLVMSDDDVDAAVNFGDALADLQSAWTAIQQKFGAQMLPMFTRGLVAAANALGRVSNAVSKAFQTGDWSEVFSTITDEIGALLPKLINKALDVAAGIFENADKIIDLATSIIVGLMDGIEKAIPKIIQRLPKILNSIWNGIKRLVQSFGNLIIDVINSAFGTKIQKIDLSGVKDAFQWFVDNNDVIVAAITAIVAAFAVTKIIGFVKAIGTLVASFNPLTIILAAVAAAILLVVANWDKIKPWLGKVWKTTVEWVQNAWKAVSDAFDKAGKWVSKVWKTTVEWVQNAWKAVGDAFTEAGKWLGKTWKVTVQWARKAWKAVGDSFTKAGEWVEKTFPTTVKWVRTGWALIKSSFTQAGKWADKAFTSTIEWVQNAWTDVSTAFSAAAGWVKGKAHKIVLSWTATVAKWIKRIWGWITGQPIDDGSGLNGADLNSIKINLLSGTVGKWIKTIWDWVTNGVNIVVNFTKKAVEAATNDSGLLQGGVPSGPAWGESIDAPEVPSGWGFAKGLNYVPFNNYPALLHRGEAVLNQSQGREWRQGGSGFNMRELYEAVASAVASAVSSISIDMDGKAVGNAVTEQVSRNIYRSQMGRRVGVI